MAVTANPQAPKAQNPVNGNQPSEVKKARKTSPPDETKEQKWKRLVNSRGPKAVKMIRNLSNLGNRAAYEFTDEQAQKLIAALMVEVNALKQRLETKAKADVPTAIV